MTILTTKEKADRFDALQTALAVTKENYDIRQKDAEAKYTNADVIGAYNKGLADAYKCIAGDLERWIL